MKKPAASDGLSFVLSFFPLRVRVELISFSFLTSQPAKTLLLPAGPAPSQPLPPPPIGPVASLPRPKRSPLRRVVETTPTPTPRLDPTRRTTVVVPRSRRSLPSTRNRRRTSRRRRRKVRRTRRTSLQASARRRTRRSTLGWRGRTGSARWRGRGWSWRRLGEGSRGRRRRRPPGEEMGESGTRVSLSFHFLPVSLSSFSSSFGRLSLC